MYCAGFDVSQAELSRGTATVDALVERLARTNVDCMRGGVAPPLYRSGVVYREDPIGGGERFRTANELRARGYGDCDSLCAWRVAELRLLGYPARAFSVVNQDQYGVVYHVLVQTPWGVEDPSRVLGMR